MKRMSLMGIILTLQMSRNTASSMASRYTALAILINATLCFVYRFAKRDQ